MTDADSIDEGKGETHVTHVTDAESLDAGKGETLQSDVLKGELVSVGGGRAAEADMDAMMASDSVWQDPTPDCGA